MESKGWTTSEEHRTNGRRRLTSYSIVRSRPKKIVLITIPNDIVVNKAKLANTWHVLAAGQTGHPSTSSPVQLAHV
jgi:hypothetical protein